MACKQRGAKTPTQISKNEKYLHSVFSLLKKRDSLTVADRKSRFNDTELRLMGEVLTAKYEGKRLISTQLAKLLGVTRSAISQIVNRLEEQGVVKRVPDDVDRKIAYIEITESTLSTYEEDLKTCADFIGGVVSAFGEEKFETMCESLNEFIVVLEQEKIKQRRR